uniref:Uncharacterized protein n=1 Tax=Arundo donax TaxID=35708 RepID=A0A0A9F6W1_ARUDO
MRIGYKQILSGRKQGALQHSRKQHGSLRSLEIHQ